MILTEAEAKEKLCQETFSLIDPEDQRSHIQMPGARCCIASDCMAWREIEPVSMPTGRLVQRRKKGTLDQFESVDEIKLVRRGHCGKAGRP